ncbi:hypothetical protein OB905_10815 [Halobacteria archaeon AArc-dxtr1]|nr:hypothetical protein [Halobacteria archaeon AArc-dxtr1]
MTDGTESCADRVVALETTVTELEAQLETATNRDIPLLKGTIRALVGAEIDEIGELPESGRTFNRQVETHAERLDAVEKRLAALGEIDREKTTKEQKIAAICTFAQNKRGGRSSTVAVTAKEIQGCVGVSRRYAYDLIGEVAEVVEGARVRDAREVPTATGVEHKKKALLIDCEAVHVENGGVNQFTTRSRATGEAYGGTEEANVTE